MDKLFELMFQEFTTQGRKYQMLPNFGICCRELGDSKLRVFAHASAVPALSSFVQAKGKKNFTRWISSPFHLQ